MEWLRQTVKDRDNDPRDAIKHLEQKLNQFDVSEDFSSCFSNVVSDFLMNKINFCWRRQAFTSYQTWLPQV